MIAPLTFLTWLATYAIHSTILLVAALILSRFIANQNAREVLWKAALLGGFVTSLISAMTSFTPAAGKTWRVAPYVEPTPPPPGTEPTPTAITYTVPPPLRSSDNPAQTGFVPSQGDASFSVKSPGTAFLITTWILISMLMIARLVFRHRRILRALRDRHLLSDGPLPAMLAELRRKSAVWNPVRLSASAACPTPIALGRSEICVPERFATDLEIDQQRNALAHELAHLKRRDPLWQMGAGVIESVFFFQPLNIVARRKLREASEYIADDWAVQQTSSPLALAKCLAQISSWVGSAPVPDGMLAMAEGGSPLVSRIERLAEWQRSSKLPARVTLVASAALIAIVATSAPIFSAVPAEHYPPVASLVSFSAKRESADSVIRYAGAQGSLDQRFGWALAQNVNGPHWIAWETDVGSIYGVSSSTEHLDFTDERAPQFSSIVGTTPTAARVAILVRFGGGKAIESQLNGVAFLRVRSKVWLGGGAILWIGNANNAESLALIQRLIKGSRNPDMRSELAAAYTVHSNGDLVIPGTRALIESEGNSGVRTEAIQWLARIHGTDPRAVDLLKDQTLHGRDADSRMEAVDGLRTSFAHGSARARAALMEVADHASDMRVRSEAMQTLSRIDKGRTFP
jgi:beta-lactamase regulating signal transducer with metallopeptidase domain